MIGQKVEINHQNCYLDTENTKSKQKRLHFYKKNVDLDF